VVEGGGEVEGGEVVEGGGEEGGGSYAAVLREAVLEQECVAVGGVRVLGF
jgi:hypothetical protein